MLLAILTGVLGIVIASKSGALRALVIARIESAVGCKATCRSAVVDWRGHLVVTDLKLTVAGLDGPEAEFLQLRRMTVRPDWSRFLAGRGAIRNLTFLEPRVRLSMGEGGSLNVAPLARGKGTPGPLRNVPSITILEGIIELAEHDAPGGPSYRLLDSMPVSGSLTELPDRPAIYALQLVESRPPTSPDAPPRTDLVQAMRLSGEIDFSTLASTLALHNVDLAAWGRKTAPTPVRDLWNSLEISGRISRTDFTIRGPDELSTTFMLDGVRMRLPLPARRAEDAPESGPVAEQIQMDEVSGQISVGWPGGLSATLAGVIEGLPCDVTFKMEDLNPQAALECRILTKPFPLVQRPDLLPLAPRIVRRLVQRFSSPTAEVNGSVLAKRGPPTADGPARLQISGLIEFTQGRAEYELFRYPVTDMAGTISFDDTAVNIDRVVGRGKTGASLLASGRIWPPRDGAAVDLNITVVEVPLDEAFREALPEHRRPVFDALFDREAHARLEQAGLLEGHGSAADPAPGTFALGGTAELTIRIRRELGAHTPYTNEISLKSPLVNAVPRAFPYPIVLSGLHVLVRESEAQIECESARGLSGAEVGLSGRVSYSATSYSPDLRCTARATPIDALLLAALPGGVARAPDLKQPGAEPTIHDTVRAFNLSGQIDAAAHVTTRAAGRLGYTIDLSAGNLRAEAGASPPGAERPVAGFPLSAIAGAATVDELGLRRADVKGTVGGGASGPPGTMTFTADSAPGHDPPVRLTGTLSLADLDLQHPIERLVRLMAPDQGARLDELRAAHHPRGVLDAALEFSRGGAAGEYRLTLQNPREISVDLLGGRLALEQAQGQVTISGDGLGFEGVSARVKFDGDEAGVIQAQGTRAMRPGIDSALGMRLDGARLESPLVRALVRVASPKLENSIAPFDPAGAFAAGFDERRSALGPALWSAWIEPRELAITRRGARIAFGQMDGRLTFNAEGGRAEQLQGTAGGWRLAINGDWRGGEGPMGELTLRLDGEGLPDSLRAILPEDADRAFRAVDLDMDGPFALRDATFAFDFSAPRPAFDFRGEADFTGLRLNPSVMITDLTGSATIRVAQSASDERPQVNVRLDADRARALGLNLTSATARLESDPRSAGYVVPLIQAALYEGELTARGAVGVTTPGAYDFELNLAGVGFGPLLADLTRAADTSAPSGPAPNRGLLDGRLTFAGQAGALDSRRGRGSARITGGEVIRLPLVMPLMELSNLQAPLGGQLGQAAAEFHVRGDRAIFDDLRLESDGLAIVGQGALALSTQSLDLTLRTRSGLRVPLLSDLVETVRDEFVTTRVTGTLSNPAFTTEGFSATRRMLGTMFRGSRLEPPPQPVPSAPDASPRSGRVE